MLVRDLVPQRLRAEWSRAGYYPGKDLYGLFADRAAAHPDRTAVADDVEAVDYGQLATAVGRLANGLAAVVVAPRDVVAVQLPDRCQASAVELAVWAVGGICLSFPTVQRERESRALLTHSEAVTATCGWRNKDIIKRGGISMCTSFLALLETGGMTASAGGSTGYEALAR